MTLRHLLLAGLLQLITVSSILGQNRPALEEERKATIKAIEVTEAKLEKAKNQNAASRKVVDLIDHKIAQRESLILSLDEELTSLQAKAVSYKDQLTSAIAEQEELKRDYRDLIKSRYIYKSAGVEWHKYLSVESINEAILNWRYHRQLQNYVSIKKRNLERYQEEIVNLSNSNQKAIDQIERLSLSKVREQQTLRQELELAKTAKVNVVRKTEALKLALAKQEREWKSLNAAIETAIIRQLKRPQEVEDPDHTTINYSFAKEGVIRPLANSVISRRYGKQRHQYLPGVTINNNGIDLSSSTSNNVKACSNGKVVSINKLEDGVVMIIIQHNKYYSVYGNVRAVRVSQGQMINQGTTIGEACQSDSGLYTLHFEIWKGKTKIDPTSWIE